MLSISVNIKTAIGALLREHNRSKAAHAIVKLVSKLERHSAEELMQGITLTGKDLRQFSTLLPDFIAKISSELTPDARAKYDAISGDLALRLVLESSPPPESQPSPIPPRAPSPAESSSSSLRAPLSSTPPEAGPMTTITSPQATNWLNLMAEMRASTEFRRLAVCDKQRKFKTAAQPLWQALTIINDFLEHNPNTPVLADEVLQQVNVQLAAASPGRLRNWSGTSSQALLYNTGYLAATVFFQNPSAFSIVQQLIQHGLQENDEIELNIETIEITSPSGRIKKPCISVLKQFKFMLDIRNQHLNTDNSQSNSEAINKNSQIIEAINAIASEGPSRSKKRKRGENSANSSVTSTSIEPNPNTVPPPSSALSGSTSSSATTVLAALGGASAVTESSYTTDEEVSLLPAKRSKNLPTVEDRVNQWFETMKQQQAQYPVIKEYYDVNKSKNVGNRPLVKKRLMTFHEAFTHLTTEVDLSSIYNWSRLKGILTKSLATPKHLVSALKTLSTCLVLLDINKYATLATRLLEVAKSKLPINADTARAQVSNQQERIRSLHEQVLKMATNSDQSSDDDLPLSLVSSQHSSPHSP